MIHTPQKNGSSADNTNFEQLTNDVRMFQEEHLSGESEPETSRAEDVFQDATTEDATIWDEESGSARYTLSTELVNTKYAPLDAHFAQGAIHVTAHVLPSAGKAALQDADGYEGTFQSLANYYPERVTRLRDLYFRVQEARRVRVELEQRDEAIRVAYNERNNSNNQRIQQDITKLNEEWKERRADCEKELRDVRATLVQREETLVLEAHQAQEKLWELREQLAENWDLEVAQTREREGQYHLEKEQHRWEERAAIREKQKEFEAAAENANEELHVVRLAVAEVCKEAVHLADEELEASQKAAVEEWNTFVQTTEERARTLQSHYEQARSEASHALHATRQQVALAHTELDSLVGSAEKERNTAAARAGVPSVEVEKYGVREALLNYLPGSRTGEGDDTDEYLLPEGEVQSAKKTWLQKTIATVTLLIFGSIFGTSLGLLFEAFRISSLIDPSKFIEKSPLVLTFFVIGAGVFYVFGRAIEHFVTLAVEAWQPKEQTTKSLRYSWTTTVLAIVVVVGFIIVEMMIERHGLVGSLEEANRLNCFGDAACISLANQKSDKNAFAYWCIALVAALPFALFHVGTAWRRAKQNVAVAARRALLARRERGFLERPEVAALINAQAALESARAKASMHSMENDLALKVAQQRITDVEEEYKTNPDVLRYAEIDNERETFFANHPGVKIARETRIRLDSWIEANPDVVVAKERYESFCEKANLLNKWLGQNLIETGTKAAEALVERMGAIAGDAAQTIVDNAIKAPVFSMQGAESLVNNAFHYSYGKKEEGLYPTSYREQMAEQRLNEQKNRLSTDPTILFCRARIKSLQNRLLRMEESYKRRITSLKKQRRSVELVPGAYLARELSDAEAQVLSAQLQFEQEYAKVLRLAELPRLIRWFSHLQEVWLRPDGVVTYAEAATKARPALLPSETRSEE